MRPLPIAGDEVVFSEGDHGSEMYIVVNGMCESYKRVDSMDFTPRAKLGSPLLVNVIFLFFLNAVYHDVCFGSCLLFFVGGHHNLPDEMPPRGDFIVPENIVVDGLRFRRRCHYRQRRHPTQVCVSAGMPPPVNQL